MPKLVDRAGNIHEWDSDAALDSDNDMNDDETNRNVTEEELLTCRMRKVPEWAIVVIVASLYRYRHSSIRADSTCNASDSV
jgi:hypothetical protein